MEELISSQLRLNSLSVVSGAIGSSYIRLDIKVYSMSTNGHLNKEVQDIQPRPLNHGCCRGVAARVSTGS